MLNAPRPPSPPSLLAPAPPAQEHYSDLKTKGFFPGLVAYMISGPVVAMVWEGKDVIAGGRRLLGATKPSDSAVGTSEFEPAPHRRVRP